MQLTNIPRCTILKQKCEHGCSHFCFQMVYCGIREWCIMRNETSALWHLCNRSISLSIALCTICQMVMFVTVILSFASLTHWKRFYRNWCSFLYFCWLISRYLPCSSSLELSLIFVFHNMVQFILRSVYGIIGLCQKVDARIRLIQSLLSYMWSLAIWSGKICRLMNPIFCSFYEIR